MKRTALIAVATAFALNAFAAPNNPAAPPSATGTTASAAAQADPPKLSRSERKARLEKLEQRFRDFLTLVEPIIHPTEIDVLLSLENDQQRDLFVDDFWRRRDGGEASGSYRERYLALREIALERYRNLGFDQPRVLLVHGEPSADVAIDCPEILQPVEIWEYAALADGSRRTSFIFYKPRYGADYKLLFGSPMSESDAMNELVSADAANDGITFSDIMAAAGGQRFTNAETPLQRAVRRCGSLPVLIDAFNASRMARSRVATRAFSPPPIDEERTRDFLKGAVVASKGAPELTLASATVAPQQNPGVRKLSRRERKERIAALDEKYRSFLLEVEPILVDVEQNAFLLLETDAQRDAFIEEFWRIRDRLAGRGAGAFRQDYLERLQEARQRFKYLASDRSRIFLIHGRPAEVLESDCRQYLQPVEVWFYPYVEGVGSDISMLFYQARSGGDYRLWRPMRSLNDELADLLSNEVVATLGEQRGVQEVFYGSAAGGGAQVSKVYISCKHGDQILRAIFKTNQDKFLMMKLFDAPDIGGEDAGKMVKNAVIPTPGARVIPAELSSRFPAKRGARTIAEMTVLLRSAELAGKEVNEERFFNVDVTGEVLRDGKMYERFRYRFDYPAAQVGESVPVVVERYLRPGNYRTRLKVVDVNSGAEAIVEGDLDVPYIQDSAERVAQEREGNETVDRLRAGAGTSRLRIAPLGTDIVTGLQKIETIVSGDAVKGVEFYVDGKKVMVKRTPPFSLELDLGSVPRTRRIRAVGLDDDGDPVAADEALINAGIDPFQLRIVSPSIATKLSGRIRVEAEARIPEGKKLQHIELYLNDTKLATLFDPPFVSMVTIPPDLEVGYLRAVGTLTDEATQPVEDIVFINSPAFMQQIDVHLVELPVTVIRDGRPLLGLQQSAFKVLDEGKEAEISKFEYVRDLPLSIGLAVDSSGSMSDKIAEAQKAGAQFFQNMLKEGDKAFVVAFDTQPYLVQKWSRKLSDLNAGLASLRAEELTSLYDSIVFSLYHFQGVRGQKALIVISDGKDTSSKFSFEQSLEYARRAGIPIYAIAIGLRPTEVDVRYKLTKFANETGGAIYSIDRAADLARVYGEIENELRSQYILGIYPPPGTAGGGDWRNVSVEVNGAKVKTISGYYP